MEEGEEVVGQRHPGQLVSVLAGRYHASRYLGRPVQTGQLLSRRIGGTQGTQRRKLGTGLFNSVLHQPLQQPGVRD